MTNNDLDSAPAEYQPMLGTWRLVSSENFEKFMSALGQLFQLWEKCNKVGQKELGLEAALFLQVIVGQS